MVPANETFSAKDDEDLMSRTWNRLETDLQKKGFREGALKGQEESFQTGFDIGYSEGFRIGEIIGFNQSILNSHKQLNVESEDSTKQNGFSVNSSEAICILCLENNNELEGNSELQNLTGIISKQEDINNKIIKKLKYNYEND